MSEISYSKKNDRIECVRYKEWRKSYPPHTHTAHMTVGYIFSWLTRLTISRSREYMADAVRRNDVAQLCIIHPDTPERIRLLKQF